MVRCQIILLLIALNFPAHSFAKSPENFGKWFVAERTDDFSKTSDVIAWTTAESVIVQKHLRDPERGATAFFNVQCDQNKLHVWFHVNKTLVYADRALIEVKFDDESPQKAIHWPAHSDYAGGEIPSGAKSIAFAKQLSKIKILRLRMIDNVFGQTDLTFSMDGYAFAVAAIKQRCKF